MLWFKKNYKQAIAYAIIYVVLILFFTYPMPYQVYLPGGIDTAQNFVEIDHSYSSTGTINESYVSVITKPTPFQYVVSQFNNKAETRKLSTQENNTPISEMNKSNELYKLSSIYYALFAAYDAAGKEIHADKDGLVFIDPIILPRVTISAYSQLKVGDIIVNINGTTITDYDDATKVLDNLGCNDPINLTVLRNNKTLHLSVTKTDIDEKGTCILGIESRSRTYTNYQHFTASPTFKLLDTSGYGPSAGLLQALSIYNMLTETDITYGLKIAGTGTIDEAGNVGPIGGIKQKVYGACKAHVDVFFAPDVNYGDPNNPSNNYQDALEAKQIMKSNIKIVPVKTLEDAINYLKDHYGTD